MKGGTLILAQIKERHKPYKKATTKDDIKQDENINWINKQIELENKGELGKDERPIWEWVKNE